MSLSALNNNTVAASRQTASIRGISNNSTSQAAEVRSTPLQHNAYKQVLTGVESLRQASTSSQFANVFNDLTVGAANQRKPNDTPGARNVKQNYQREYNRARESRRQAEQTMSNLAGKGAGPHRMPNGDTVKIERGLDGTNRVITQRPDGSSTKVELSKDPTHVKVTSTDPKGHQLTLERNGTDVRSSDGQTETRYGLTGGQPYERKSDYTGTTLTQVNPDGTTTVKRALFAYPDGHGQIGHEEMGYGQIGHEETGYGQIGHQLNGYGNIDHQTIYTNDPA